ncbi:MAG: ankyrin repeat domain-containing protein [Burkholderiales bacterium]
MIRLAARMATHASWILVALVLTGCAGLGGRGADDADRVNNMITTDDVGALRGAIQSGELKPNQAVPTPAYPDGAPIIAIAARAAALDVLKYLISIKADVNARTPVNETPLMLASFFFDETLQGPRAFERHEQAVRLLVAAGADLENYPHNYTALSYAAYQGNERVVRFLIEKGARVNADARNGGSYVNTPLMMAAIQGHESVVRLLLRAGADADVRIYGGHTAAELAAKYRHAALSQLLLCSQRQYAVAPVAQCQGVLGLQTPERYSAR